MIKLCVFDLDGTLLNTLGSITYYVNKTLQKHNIQPIGIDDVRSFVGSGSENLIKKCLEFRDAYSSEDFFKKTHADYKSSYDKAPLYLTEPYAGIEELIAALKTAGVRLAVLSNKPHSAVVPICEHFFPNAFDMVLGASAENPLKPDPTMLIDIMSKFSAEPSEVAYFGDTGTDIETGIRANVSISCGVLWGFRDRGELVSAGASALVSHPSEIIEVIK